MDSDSSSDLSSLPSALSSPSPPSSPLSSLASLSPSPPPDDIREMLYSSRARAAPYPSPPASQQTSNSGSPAPDGMESSTTTEKDGPPPAKRRRISKERTTEYLDLHADGVDEDQQPQLDRLLHVLHKRQKIVVIAGAGISVSAGIPDFRSSQGLFRSLKEEYNLKGSGKHLFDASVYKDDVSTSSFHDMVSTMSRLTKDAKPTAFHHMLATIAQEDRLLRLYSQNVDGIDTSMQPLRTSVPLSKEQDGKWPRTVQLHGGLDKMVCSKCHELSDLDPELFDGPIAPLCPRCEEINDIRTNHEGKRSHGIGRLRPRMVLYNEHNPDDEAIGAVTKDDLRKRPDAVIVVGTTLKVPGVRRIVREMCATVRDRRGGVTVWINNDPPPVAKDLEDCWDIIVHGRSDDVAKHAAMRKWDAPDISDSFCEVSDEDAKKTSAKSLGVCLSAKCELQHAKLEPLPSALHRNNSFIPPPFDVSTPRKPLDRGPADWSPLNTPRPSIVQSIERSSDESTIAVTPKDSIEISGLMTPSKSQRSTPVKKASAKKVPSKKPQVSLTDKLKDASKPKKQKATKSATTTASVKAPKKGPNIKYVKPPLSQTKTKQKGKTKPQPQTLKLTSQFKSSKGTVSQGKSDKNEPPSPTLPPSSLRQVDNASSPISELSPHDPRNNALPGGLACDEAKDAALRRDRMSISSITN